MELEALVNQLISNYGNIKEDYLTLTHYLNFYKAKLAGVTEELERSLANYRMLLKAAEEMASRLDLDELPTLDTGRLGELRLFY